MDEVVSSYALAFDELNILTETSFYFADGEDLSAKIAQIADDLLSFLINGYTLGVNNAAKMLGSDLTVNIGKMEDAIYLVIDGKTFEDRVADHVLADDLTGLQTLAESEFHRVYNAGVVDGGQEYVDTGDFGVTKTWGTMLDERVRETHAYLESVSVPLEEEFFTFDGDHAPYPGLFQNAENNVNCRCFVLLKPSDGL